MTKNPQSRLLIRRLMSIQFAVVVTLPLLALLKDAVSAYSMLIGVLTGFVPNAYFAYRAFKYQGARSARKIIRSFYVGEGVKLFLTVVFFGLAFALVRPINELAVFIGFIAILATSWLTPVLTVR